MAGINQLVSHPAPKQSRIVEDLRARILSGEFPAGCQLPSTVKMAKAYKSSVVTIQRGLRHLRKDGFITARKRAGTYVAKNPPHLSNYAMVGPHHVECRFFTALQQAAHDLFSGDSHKTGPNRSITVYNQAECRPEEVEASHLSLMEEAVRHRLAGAIFTAPPLAFAGTPILQMPDLPRVVLAAMPFPGVPTVMLQGFMERALDYLASRGRNRIAVIMLDADNEDACLEQLRNAGISTPAHWVQGVSFTTHWARNIAKLLLDRGPHDRPDGLIITDDNLVPAATRGVMESGVSVPGDLEIVAHANFPYVTESTVPATRIGYNIHELVRTSIDLLERQRRGEDVPHITCACACRDDEVAP